MIYVQYVLAFIAVFQMFLILALFGRVEILRRLHHRDAQAGIKLCTAMMGMQKEINVLKRQVEKNVNIE